MSVNKVLIKNASQYLFMGHVGLIARYQQGKLKESSFPIPVLIVDEDTKEEYEADLVSALGFSYEVIPDIFCRFFHGKPSEEATKELLEKYKVSNINQLGFYVYEYRSQNSN
jgi:hypothetical protein